MSDEMLFLFGDTKVLIYLSAHCLSMSIAY